LEKIISNLITNAIKYSGENTEIKIETARLKDTLKIKVKDEGIGIDKKTLEFIFNPFYRAESVVHIQGTGLGLNIVKSFVEVLGGEIFVESEPGKGTVFEVQIRTNLNLANI